MAYFKKGVGLVKVAYKSNFEMRSLNVNFKAGGSSFTPQLYGVDGLSSVNIVDESLGKAMITAPLDVISIDLPPEYENIGSKAFLACSNLGSVYVYAGKVITIADDAFPANCVVYVDNEFLTEYQTDHPLLDIRGFNSGYVYEIPYVDGFTPTTLTAQYVNDLFDGMTLDRKTKIGKVVVPVGFTAYESGSINAIIAQTPNLGTLSVECEAGTADFDMDGEIVQKIESIGKTLDEALVYGRTWKGNVSQATNNSDIIVVLPNFIAWRPSTFNNCPNLVAVLKPKVSDYSKFANSCFVNCPNLIFAEVDFDAKIFGCYLWFSKLTSLKVLHLNFLQGTQGDPNTFLSLSSNNLPVLTDVTLDGISDTFGLRLPPSQLPASGVVRVLQGIGNARVPGDATSAKIRLYVSTYQALTEQEKQIATDKGWVVDGVYNN